MLRTPFAQDDTEGVSLRGSVQVLPERKGAGM